MRGRPSDINPKHCHMPFPTTDTRITVFFDPLHHAEHPNPLVVGSSPGGPAVTLKILPCSTYPVRHP